MARQVLPIVGAIIGGIYGGPSGAQAGYAIGSLVGNAVDPLVIKGPRIGDASVQTSAEGVFRPVVFGTAAVAGNVIERGNRQIKKKRTQQGKGGPVSEEERVYWTFAIRICEGPISGILRIWEDEKLIFDARTDSPIPEETTDFFSKVRIYLGDEEQLPDPDLESYKGIGNVNAYRGTAYIVFPNWDLTDRRESIATYRFEVSQLTALVVPGTTMALGKNELGSVRVASSYNGTEWSLDKEIGSLIGPSALYALNNGRFLARNNTAAAYSDDQGDTWVTVTESFSGDGPSGCAIVGDVVIIGRGLNGYYRSENNGASFTNFSSPQLQWIASTADGLLVGISQYNNNFWWSSDQGLSWNMGTTHGLDLAVGGSAWSAGSTMFFGGRSAGRPAVSSTTSGISKAITVFDPSSDVGIISGAAYYDQDAVLWMVVGGSDDGLAWRMGSDGGVVHAIPSFGANLAIQGVIYNGLNFVLGTRSVLGVGDSGFIYTSDGTGEVWTQRTHYLTDEIDALASQPAVQPEGQGKPVELSAIVSAIHERAQSYDYEVTELTDMVDGVVLAGDYTCAEAIKTLAPVYFFDSPEFDDGTGYKIRYRKRGRPAVLTLVDDDFVSTPDKTVRADSLERPRVLHMSFQSPTAGYAAAKASPARNSPDVLVVGEVSLQVPVAFNSVDEAWQRADIMLKQTWVEVGGEEEFVIPDVYLSLVPADIVGVYLRGQARRMRITQIQVEPGQMTLKLLPDRQSAYTSNITGLDLPEPTPPPSSVVGQTILAVLDIPALNDNNDRLLEYMGMSGQTDAWYGAQAQLSTDGGANWQDAVATNVNTIMGSLQNTVTAASPHYLDTTNTVGVSLYMDDEIESLTNQQFLSEGGSFAVEYQTSSGSHWEVLQYRDAEQDSNGVWWLSHLARGRLNTEAAEHVVGQRVVFLDGVLSVDAVSSWINTELTYRAISFGNSADGVATQSEVYTGQAQLEWPVASLTLSLAGSTLSARAVPRHRFGTEDRPVRSQNWQSFRWIVTDGSNTITTDTIDQATSFDVTGWSTPITVSVAQVNRITGPGPYVSEQIA